MGHLAGERTGARRSTLHPGPETGKGGRPRRLRIVQFTNDFRVGGGEVQVLTLLRALPAHYHVEVHVLDARGPLLEETRSLGYEPHVHRLGGSLLRAGSVAEIVRLARHLARERVDVVHAQDFYATLVAVPAARLARVPVVVSRLDLVHWHGPARHLALAAASHAADAVVANCDAIRDLLLYREHIAPGKVTVIRNGLDVARFDAMRSAGTTAPLPSTAGAPVAVLVANMRHPVKRHEDFLHALARVRAAVPRVKAFLVGEGELRPELERLARSLRLGGAVHFLGRRLDVPAILARATFGVLCSRQEGLPNAVMEEMAAGLPVVVTDAGGNGELVRDGVRGYVVPVERPDALAHAMLRLISDPEQARRMGQAARRFVRKELSVEKMVAAHDRLYRRLARVPLLAAVPAPAAAPGARTRRRAA
jgi:glycosyltransferase involved in cell wall biosynthesis